MISILLAVYNGEKYIKHSIESVLNQSFKNFELLIGFNGTTDDSKKIVSNYDDNRIKTFDFGDDKGKSKTLNKLLSYSTYNWIAIQDDDDVWLPNKLEKQLVYIENFDVVGTFIKYIDEHGNYKGNPNLSTEHNEILHKSFMGNNQVANTSAIFKKEDALQVGGWRNDIDGIEDFDFWLKLMRQGKKFININEFLVEHRLHNKSNFNTKKYDLKLIL